jgi:hypothetical protein
VVGTCMRRVVPSSRGGGASPCGHLDEGGTQEVIRGHQSFIRVHQWFIRGHQWCARSPCGHLDGSARPMHVPEPVQQQRVRPARQRREIELREHADETWMPYLDWRSSQVKSSQVKSGQAKSSQVKSSQVRSSHISYLMTRNGCHIWSRQPHSATSTQLSVASALGSTQPHSAISRTQPQSAISHTQRSVAIRGA